MDSTIGPQPWDGFLAGEENALALASVSSLARGEGEGLSPLVLHGPSGVGKTRLLAGLVAERLIRRPESSVAETTGEAFAALCGEASAQPGGWLEIRSRFRHVDLLALDGLEALIRVPPSLDELTHTLDALEARGAVVAVTSRTAPGQWTDWPSRLVNRLLGGLAVRVDPPGLASRRRYLLERIRAKGIALTADAVDALADSADGYRTLDGWLARLALAARVERRPLDWPLVEPFLADEANPPPPAPSLDVIARAVALRFGVKLRDLRGEARQPQYVEPRHLAMHLARVYTKFSFVAIGKYFGGRDPATVRHACKAAESRIATDPALASTAQAIAVSWKKMPA
jgi:chromosomal replication initiator protein